MKALLDYIIKSLVKNKNQVKIDEKEDEKSITLTITVAPDDFGRIIGREGKIIKAIRRILRMAAIATTNKKVYVITNESTD